MGTGRYLLRTETTGQMAYGVFRNGSSKLSPSFPADANLGRVLIYSFHPLTDSLILCVTNFVLC